MKDKMLQQMVKAGFTTAQKLLASGLKVNSLRTNDTLRKDEWKQYDAAIVEAAQQRLVVVADLMSRGLVYRIGNGLGKTVLEYEDQSDMSDAEVNMDGVTRGRNDRIEFDINYLPLPITHKDWHLNIRVLNASRQGLSHLDTTQAALASRKVSEKIENYAVNGASSFAFGGGTIYGLTDHPNRNTGTLNAAWSTSTTTGDNMLDDLKAMKQTSIDDRHYGPWMVYIPTAYETALDDDYKAASDKSIRARLKEISGLIDIRVADLMGTSSGKTQIVMVQMTADVIRMVEGLPLTNVEWDEQGGMVTNFKVMTILVPQVRADQDDRSGVVNYVAP